jgi:hypothetical protein
MGRRGRASKRDAGESPGRAVPQGWCMACISPRNQEGDLTLLTLRELEDEFLKSRKRLDKAIRKLSRLINGV